MKLVECFVELIENEQNDNFKTRFLLLYLMEWDGEKKRRNEGDLISVSNISAYFECSLQDQLHLESENGIEMKMKYTCCLNISSEGK